MTIFLSILAVLVLAGLVVWLFFYRPAIRVAYARLDGLERQSTETPYGTMEYALGGEGKPVLLIHGACGGYDQGMSLARGNVPTGYGVIAPSRFGDLGSSLPHGANVAMQAEAYATLLKQLDHEQAVVMAYSAGGPSAIQLALRHPERVAALILVSTAISDEELDMPPRRLMRRVVSSDFLFWLLTHPLRFLAQRAFVPAGLKFSAAERERLDKTLDEILPVRPRAQGLLFDFYVSTAENLRDYQLEELKVPVLLINARDDTMVKYEAAVEMSKQIPNARVLLMESGGHLMLDSDEQVSEEIAGFLREHLN